MYEMIDRTFVISMEEWNIRMGDDKHPTHKKILDVFGLPGDIISVGNTFATIEGSKPTIYVKSISITTREDKQIINT